MASLDNRRIIDPRTRIKLDLDSNERKTRITPFTDSVESHLTLATKNSSSRVERKIKSIENSNFNPLDAISKVLKDSKKSQKMNSFITQKVFVNSEQC